jgi:hypothetical protein
MLFQLSAPQPGFGNRFQNSQASATKPEINIFDRQGSDFLDPSKILREVDHFSDKLGTVTHPQLFTLNTDTFDTKADAEEIASDTNRELDKVFSGTLISDAVANSALGTGASATTGLDNTGLDTVFGLGAGNTLGGGFFTGLGSNTLVATNVRPSNAFLEDLLHFNPLIWKNPSATNVLFGTMDAQNVVYGGTGFLPRPFVNSPIPLFPFITPPGTPFNDLLSTGTGTASSAGSSGTTGAVAGTGGLTLANSLANRATSLMFNPLDTLQEAQLFPRTFLSGQPLFERLPGTPPTTGTGNSGTSLQIKKLLQDKVDALQKQLDESTGRLSNVLHAKTSKSYPFKRKKAEALQIKAKVDQITLELAAARKELDDFISKLIVQASMPSSGGGSTPPSVNIPITAYITILNLLNSMQQQQNQG